MADLRHHCHRAESHAMVSQACVFEAQGALTEFVASQFNLLEMVAPHIVPEFGVTRYEDDLTQGPACAIAAGAATIHRNYLVPVAGGEGQTTHRQLDGLADLGVALRRCCRAADVGVVVDAQ